MKKPLYLLTAAMLLTVPANAQDWKEALKKAATSVADQATDGKLTAYALAGEWKYTGPGIHFEGKETIGTLGASAIESAVTPKLEKTYRLAGIEPGFCTFAFDREDAFTVTTDGRELSGTYQYEAGTHAVTLRFAKGKLDLGTMTGYAYIQGDRLQLLFPVTKLVGMVTALGSKISSLRTVTALLEKYENVYLGFEFGK